MSAGPVGTPYGVATDYGDAVVRYVMHGECPPLPLTQALRDEAETLRTQLAEAVALLRDIAQLGAASREGFDSFSNLSHASNLSRDLLAFLHRIDGAK
jgi:hypothetical protein